LRNFAENCLSLNTAEKSVDSSCSSLACEEMTSVTRSFRFVLHLAFFFFVKKNKKKRLITFAIGSCACACSHTTHRDHRHTSSVPGILFLSRLQSRLDLSRYDNSEEYTALLLVCVLPVTFWDVNARL
jgi:hypothetical protein